MSRIQQPLTLPVHPELLEEINDASIAIKVHHLHNPEESENPEGFKKVRVNYEKPTWEQIESLLMRCHRAINEQRKDPRKY